MLDDISGVRSFHSVVSRTPCVDIFAQVKTWDKVNSGMLKMYRAEVLGKLPVIQHFLFGSILLYEGPSQPDSGSSEGSPDDAHWGHAHARTGTGAAGQREVGWGDCCGIPVPSAFAAAEAEKHQGPKLEGPGVRPVPFD